MILGMSVGAFTILHVIITLVAIGSGLIVVGGMFASNRLPVATAIFLFTTALTSLTGFPFFPSMASRRRLRAPCRKILRVISMNWEGHGTEEVEWPERLMGRAFCSLGTSV